MDTERIQRRLAVAFNDPNLLSTALTHRSATKENNERLEYLGDAVLGLVVAETLYDMYPNATEGMLSRYRANLVKGETLAEIAKEINLGEFLRLGSGELKSGGFRRGSILADALESVFGAIYLDQGLEVARVKVLELYGERFSRLAKKVEHKDPKTRLQEYLQANQLELPRYDVIRVEGQPHKQTFVVACQLAKPEMLAQGEGSSRRRAEQNAARKLLEQLVDD